MMTDGVKKMFDRTLLIGGPDQYNGAMSTTTSSLQWYYVSQMQVKGGIRREVFHLYRRVMPLVYVFEKTCSTKAEIHVVIKKHQRQS